MLDEDCLLGNLILQSTDCSDVNGTDKVSCWSLKYLQQKAKEKELDLHSGGVIKWVHYYPGGLWGLVRPNWCRRNSYAMPALPCKAVLFDPFGQPCGQGVDASTFCLLLEGKVSTVCLIVCIISLWTCVRLNPVNLPQKVNQKCLVQRNDRLQLTTHWQCANQLIIVQLQWTAIDRQCGVCCAGEVATTDWPGEGLCNPPSPNCPMFPMFTKQHTTQRQWRKCKYWHWHCTGQPVGQLDFDNANIALFQCVPPLYHTPNDHCQGQPYFAIPLSNSSQTKH